MYYLVSKITWEKGTPKYEHVKYLNEKKDAIEFNNIQTKKEVTEYICWRPDEYKGALKLVTDMDKPEATEAVLVGEK